MREGGRDDIAVQERIGRLSEMLGGTVLLTPDGKVVATYREVGGCIWTRKYRHLRHAENAARRFVERRVHRSARVSGSGVGRHMVSGCLRPNAKDHQHLHPSRLSRRSARSSSHHFGG